VWAIVGVLRFRNSGSNRVAWWTAAAIVACILTRASVGVGVGVGACLAVAAPLSRSFWSRNQSETIRTRDQNLTQSRTTRHHAAPRSFWSRNRSKTVRTRDQNARARRGAAVIVGGAVVGFAAHVIVNWAKFGSLTRLPAERQLLSLNDPDRAAWFAGNNDSFFSLRFLGTTVVHYLRPDTVRFERLLPFVRYGPLASDRGSYPMETVTASASLTATATLLVVASVIGLALIVHRRAWTLLTLTVGGVIAAGPTFTIGFIGNRYLVDMLPMLLVPAALTFATLAIRVPRVAHDRHRHTNLDIGVAQASPGTHTDTDEPDRQPGSPAADRQELTNHDIRVAPVAPDHDADTSGGIGGQRGAMLRNGVRRRAVAVGAIVLVAWGAWVNVSLALWTQNLKEASFTEWRYRVDGWVFGEPAPGLIDLSPGMAVPRDGVVALDHDPTSGRCSGVYIAEQGVWVALQQSNDGRRLAGTLTLGGDDPGARVAIGKGWSVKAVGDATELRFVIDMNDQTYESAPIPHPADDRVQFELIADPVVGQVAINADGTQVLFAFATPPNVPTPTSALQVDDDPADSLCRQLQARR
jgi:hypothetical protein